MTRDELKKKVEVDATQANEYLRQWAGSDYDDGTGFSLLLTTLVDTLSAYVLAMPEEKVKTARALLWFISGIGEEAPAFDSIDFDEFAFWEDEQEE